MNVCIKFRTWKTLENMVIMSGKKPYRFNSGKMEPRLRDSLRRQ